MEQAERSTKELKLENDITVVLYEYITGRERRAIMRPYNEQAQIKSTAKSEGKNVAKEGNVEVTTSATVNEDMENIALQKLIKEVRVGKDKTITGEQEKVDFVLDLPESEFTKVIAEINNITSEKPEKKA